MVLVGPPIVFLYSSPTSPGDLCWGIGLWPDAVAGSTWSLGLIGPAGGCVCGQRCNPRRFNESAYKLLSARIRTNCTHHDANTDSL